MKEITMIATCEITFIELMSDEDAALVETDERLKEKIRMTLRDDLGADHVNVLKKKLFIRNPSNQN